jgi:hypothetical protein
MTHSITTPLVPQDLKVCGRYNWRDQPERLMYLGVHHDHSFCRGWYQFAKMDNPQEVWCEVRAEELKRLEESP